MKTERWKKMQKLHLFIASTGMDDTWRVEEWGTEKEEKKERTSHPLLSFSSYLDANNTKMMTKGRKKKFLY